MDANLQATYDTVLQRNQGEPEFHQAVREIGRASCRERV